MIKFNSVDSFSDHHPQNTADQVLAILSLSWRQKVTMWRDGRIPASALEAPDDVDFCGWFTHWCGPLVGPRNPSFALSPQNLWTWSAKCCLPSIFRAVSVWKEIWGCFINKLKRSYGIGEMGWDRRKSRLISVAFLEVEIFLVTPPDGAWVRSIVSHSYCLPLSIPRAKKSVRQILLDLINDPIYWCAKFSQNSPPYLLWAWSGAKRTTKSSVKHIWDEENGENLLVRLSKPSESCDSHDNLIGNNWNL